MEKLSLYKTGQREGAELDRSLVDAINNLPNGHYDVYIVDKDYRVSTPQLKLFWMWMTYLEKWSGESRVKWHDHYCRSFLPPHKQSTRELSAMQMRDFLDNIQVDALVEYGVLLPSPQNDCYNEFVLQYKSR